MKENNVGFISSRALGLRHCRTMFPFNALLSSERLKRKRRFINRDSRSKEDLTEGYARNIYDVKIKIKYYMILYYKRMKNQSFKISLMS